MYFHPEKPWQMLKMRSKEEMIIAVLHDVLEDSDITADDLKERGFSDEVLMALDCLTHRPRGQHGRQKAS